MKRRWPFDDRTGYPHRRNLRVHIRAKAYRAESIRGSMLRLPTYDRQQEFRK
jgi:hypothetical protein